MDTYSDDDGAIGSVDGNDHAFDLRYIVFRATPIEIFKIAWSFSTLNSRLTAFGDLILRGPLLREDVQSLLMDPMSRYQTLVARTAEDKPHPRQGSLLGLRADFSHDTLDAPRDYPPRGYAELNRQVLHKAELSPTYATYRQEWLGQIVHRYRAHGVPVIFVRIPTRPLHRAEPTGPSGTLVDFVLHDKVILLNQNEYTALEQPQYFVDADHLNIEGARRFSNLLAHDVNRALSEPAIVHRSDGFTMRELAAPALASIQMEHHRTRLGPILRELQIGTPIAFQSYEYAAYLAAVVLLYAILRSRLLRVLLLLICSWYFYARWNAWYLPVLIALTTTDFFAGLGIRRTDGTIRRFVLTFGVFANLAFLGTVKYAGLLTTSIAAGLGLRSDPWALRILVPVGISFHTFQSISYLIDVSRGRVEAKRNYLDYALYLAFFPQLLAGPIVRARRFFAELARARALSSSQVAAGFGQIVLGLLKKSVIADRFAATSDAYFGAVGTHAGATAAWSGAFAFAMQIYFDFSGYSDIAIGSARIFGFRFPPNFRRPYLSWTVTEFWRRWHMTLSAWLRDYLYIPLGGSRRGLSATIRNLMVTMLLGGLWHGANWTFVAWGAYHGVLLSGERLLQIRTCNGLRYRLLRRIAATFATFTLVLFGWVLFRAETFPDAFHVFHEMLAGGTGGALLEWPAVMLAAVAIGLEICCEINLLRARRLSALVRTAGLTIGLICLEIGSYPGPEAQFIYFKF